MDWIPPAGWVPTYQRNTDNNPFSGLGDGFCCRCKFERVGHVPIDPALKDDFNRRADQFDWNMRCPKDAAEARQQKEWSEARLTKDGGLLCDRCRTRKSNSGSIGLCEPCFSEPFHRATI